VTDDRRPPVAAPDASPRRARAVFALVLKLLFSVGLLTFLLTRVPLAGVADVLGRASLPGLLGACTMLFLSNVLGAWQWQHLLETSSIRIPFVKVLAYYHVGLFFNNFLPANIGGDIARVMDASRYGETRTAAVSTVVLDRIIGTVALAGLALVTTLPAIDRFHLGVLYLALAGFFTASAAALWTILHPGFLPLVDRVLARFGLRVLEKHLEDLALRFAAYRSRARMVAGLLALAAVIQLARVTVHVLVARALGISLPASYFFLFVPLLAVIVSLPISFNGIGLREGAGIVLFGLVGVDRPHAFSLQFATYLVAVAVSLLGALVVLTRIPRRAIKSRDLRRAS
jgi:hypothetical protein